MQPSVIVFLRPAHGWNVFVLELDFSCCGKDVGHFGHTGILYHERKHLKKHHTRNHQTSRESRSL